MNSSRYRRLTSHFILAEASHHTSFLRDPKSDRKEYDITMNVADGILRMFFICLHKSTARAPFFVDASQENWQGADEIKRIRRKARNTRLCSYEPLALSASRALRDVETSVVLPEEFEGKSENIILHERRVRASQAIRKNGHFLGRTADIGQAFDRHLRAHQCCYAY